MPSVSEARDAGQELLDSLSRGEFEAYLDAEDRYFALCADVLGRTMTPGDGEGLRGLLAVQAEIERQLATLSRGVAAEMVRLRRRAQASKAYLAQPLAQASGVAEG